VLHLCFRLQIRDDTASHILESAVCHCNACNVTLPTAHGKAPYRSLEQKKISLREYRYIIDLFRTNFMYCFIQVINWVSHSKERT